jgi:predicted AlkP superfamily pyrophosphatase or phosphodiesterase
MKRRILSGLFVVALLLMTTALLAAKKPQNAILIGWDGAQRAHVRECLAKGELPHLQKLIREGTLIDIDIYGVTDTKAGWSQILTGYKPEVTGVYSNSNYRPIPEGYTIFERLESYFGRDSINTVALIGKGAHVGADMPSRGGKEKKGQPYYITQKGMDIFINKLGSNDNVGNKALELLGRYRDKPFFFFVHFADVDHNGHKHGENSKEYNDALISCDAWTGRIADRLKSLHLYDTTRIYVTADHGFDEGMTHHKNAPHVFLATNDGRVKGPGRRQDISPTILDFFGVPLGAIKPPLDGRSLIGTHK